MENPTLFWIILGVVSVVGVILRLPQRMADRQLQNDFLRWLRSIHEYQTRRINVESQYLSVVIKHAANLKKVSSLHEFWNIVPDEKERQTLVFAFEGTRMLSLAVVAAARAPSPTAQRRGHTAHLKLF